MSNGTCYAYDGGIKDFVTDSYYQPCGSTSHGKHTQCCQPGSYCLSNGFCQFDSNLSRKTSLYFAAECTDPTGKDDACKNFCLDSNTYTYVKWLGGSWRCCYGERKGEGDCRNPVGERFVAPAPAKLSTSTFLLGPSIPASVLSTAIPPQVSLQGVTDEDAFQTYITSALKHDLEPTWFSAMPTAVQTYYVAPSLLPQAASNGNPPSPTASTPRGGHSPTNPPTPGSSSTNGDGTASKSSSDDLGVKVGVPVAIIVALLILGLGLFLFLRRRRARATRNGLHADGKPYASDDDPSSPAETTTTAVGSMAEAKSPDGGRVPELAASPGAAELPYTPSPAYAATGAVSTSSANANASGGAYRDEKRGGLGLGQAQQGQQQGEFALGPHPAFMPFELDGRSVPAELDGSKAAAAPR